MSDAPARGKAQWSSQMGLLWAEPGSSAIGPLRGLNQLYIFKISGWRSTYTYQQDFNSHSIFTSFKILRHQLIDEYAKGAHFCSKLLLQGRHDHRKTKPHPPRRWTSWRMCLYGGRKNVEKLGESADPPTCNFRGSALWSAIHWFLNKTITYRNKISRHTNWVLIF